MTQLRSLVLMLRLIFFRVCLALLDHLEYPERTETRPVTQTNSLHTNTICLQLELLLFIPSLCCHIMFVCLSMQGEVGEHGQKGAKGAKGEHVSNLLQFMIMKFLSCFVVFLIARLFVFSLLVGSSWSSRANGSLGSARSCCEYKL